MDVTNMAEEKVPLLLPEGPNEDVTWDSKTAHPAPSSSKVSYGTSSSQHPTPLCDHQLVTKTDQRTVNSHTQQPAMGIGHPASEPVIQQPAGLRQTQPIDGYPYQAAAINVHPKDRYKHVRREMTHSYMLLSCFVFCCCNPVAGIIALVLSLLSSGEADRNRMQEARCLGEASFWVSMIGIVLGIVTIGAVFVYFFVNSGQGV